MDARIMKLHRISLSRIPHSTLKFPKSMVLPSHAPSYSTAFGTSEIGVGKKKKSQGPKFVKDLPILIPGTGDTENEAEELIKNAAGNGRNLEFLHLHQTAYKSGKPGSAFRGFGLLKPGESQCSLNIVQATKDIKPVWMVFPGLGAQRRVMTKDVMKIPPFSESIIKSKKTVKNLGQDFDAILKLNNPQIVTDAQVAMVALTAVQIAIFDSLKTVGIRPDGIIGHSTGELLCAYADGCLSAEETILAADAHGRALKETKASKNGLMASINLGLDDIKKDLPSGLEIVGSNSFESTIVAGAADSIKEFVHKIRLVQGTNAEVLTTCGTALHFSGAEDSAELLQQYLKDVIKKEKSRSSKWISTSVGKEQMKSSLGKFVSPAYFANALKSPLLFLEATKHIPSRAIVIEISPKGILQRYLKQLTPTDCLHIAPLGVNGGNQLVHFYDVIGQLYNAGTNVAMTELYPPPRLTSVLFKPVT